MANIENSTLFGGKPYPRWQEGDFSLPGYQNARITFSTVSGERKSYTWGFLVSPSSLNVQHGNDIQVNKTMAGWFLAKGGPAVGSLTISGYMLDTLQSPERLRFMDVYMEYVEDKQNNYMEFYNNYAQSITIEGTTYHGLIQNVQMSKSANQHFMYQYTISMVFYKTNRAYAINNSLSMTKSDMWKQMGVSTSNTKQLTSVTSNSTIQMSKGVASILQGQTS